MQTSDPYNRKNVSEEELATWRPKQRARYWQGVADRRKAQEAKKQVMTSQEADL
jgi:hypothetical protein